ncbi:hypothetical protein M885DRAFT_616811 [Pelagophyceae sp. CCMP2097]|nr:hypothetical protein M885DRAFT_616811 [Pelagophyceae sp. CCMP2097]
MIVAHKAAKGALQKAKAAADKEAAEIAALRARAHLLRERARAAALDVAACWPGARKRFGYDLLDESRGVFSRGWLGRAATDVAAAITELDAEARGAKSAFDAAGGSTWHARLGDVLTGRAVLPGAAKRHAEADGALAATLREALEKFGPTFEALREGWSKGQGVLWDDEATVDKGRAERLVAEASKDFEGLLRRVEARQHDHGYLVEAQRICAVDAEADDATGGGGVPLHALAASPRGAHAALLEVFLNVGVPQVEARGAAFFAGGPWSTEGSSRCEPLHCARASAVALLVRFGADVHARGGALGETPLHRAARRGGGDSVRALLEGGALPRFADARGARAADVAAGDALAALAQHRASKQAVAVLQRAERGGAVDYRASVHDLTVSTKLRALRANAWTVAADADPAATDAGAPDGAADAAPRAPRRRLLSVPHFAALDDGPVEVRLSTSALEDLFTMGETPRTARVASLAKCAATQSAASAALECVDAMLVERGGGVCRVHVLDLPPAGAARGARVAAVELRRAAASGDVYPEALGADGAPLGVAKWYRLTRALAGLADSEEFSMAGLPAGLPFVVDPREEAIVDEWAGDSPAPTILTGRAGCGKTVVALRCVWKRYAAVRGRGAAAADADHRIVFVTESDVLCAEVARLFYMLRRMYFGDAAPPAARLPAPASMTDVPLGRFPLFLTTAELVAAMDASTAHSFLAGKAPRRPKAAAVVADAAVASLAEWLRGNRAAAGAPDAQREVTAAVFDRELWRRIVGGASVRAAPAVYLALLQKQAPNFSGINVDSSERYLSRESVWDLYENYADLLRKGGLHDRGDVVLAVAGAVRRGEYAGALLGALVIDEVQDFAPGTLEVLLSQCDADRVLLGGDTAQTISQCAWRFKDLETLLFRPRRERAAAAAEAARPNASKKKKDAGADRAAGVPGALRWRALTINYRTHQGILAAANLVVDCITQLFPRRLDKIACEEALFPGPPICLFEATDTATLVDRLGGDCGAAMEFGAHQAIIVRTSADAETLPPQLRDAIVLTPLQAKGLEFTDVFLYNFFARPLKGDDNVWGALANALGVPVACHAPEFNERTHLRLCDELKALFVALTRARERVFVFDDSRSEREPFHRLCLSRGCAEYVDARAPGAAAGKLEGLARATAPRAWRQRGDEFLARGDFLQAAKCFEKSGDATRHRGALAEALLIERAAEHADDDKARGLALDAPDAHDAHAVQRCVNEFRDDGNRPDASAPLDDGPLRAPEPATDAAGAPEGKAQLPAAVRARCEDAVDGTAAHDAAAKSSAARDVPATTPAVPPQASANDGIVGDVAAYAELALSEALLLERSDVSRATGTHAVAATYDAPRQATPAISGGVMAILELIADEPDRARGEAPRATCLAEAAERPRVPLGGGDRAPAERASHEETQSVDALISTGAPRPAGDLPLPAEDSPRPAGDPTPPRNGEAEAELRGQRRGERSDASARRPGPQQLLFLQQRQEQKQQLLLQEQEEQNLQQQQQLQQQLQQQEKATATSRGDLAGVRAYALELEAKAHGLDAALNAALRDLTAERQKNLAAERTQSLDAERKLESSLRALDEEHARRSAAALAAALRDRDDARRERDDKRRGASEAAQRRRQDEVAAEAASHACFVPVGRARLAQYDVGFLFDALAAHEIDIGALAIMTNDDFADAGITLGSRVKLRALAREGTQPPARPAQ